MRGWKVLAISRLPCLNSSATRTTFMPPAVEPAQEPTNISTSRTAFTAIGQRLKSVVAKPVVETMVATWNAP